jgi:protein-S-isoprenylcysteine O-methyltransferase Ste14
VKTKTKALLWLVIWLPIMALALFLPAGTMNWLSGWVCLALLASFSIATTLWLLKNRPGLIDERIGFKSFQKTWDKIFALVFYVIFVVWLILMPLDAVRFHWSRMPAWIQAAGALVLLSSFYIFYLAFRENPYASSAVRIQEDRGQRVVSTGPYRHVRHPMYTGAFLYCLGTALLLGSWVGVSFEPLFVAAIAIRANLEERLLREQLEGYDEYMVKVKYRFIPRLW